MTRNTLGSRRARAAATAVAALTSALVLFTSTASAATMATSASKPTSDIEGSGKSLSFQPNTLHVKFSGKPSQNENCTAKKVDAVVDNDTKASQTLIYKGQAVVTIPSGQAAGFCVWGTGTATFTFTLKADPKAKLTLDVS